MDRHMIALGLLPSFLHAYVNTDDDYKRAVEKSFKAADAFLEKAKTEPNVSLVTITWDLSPCGDCDCDSGILSEGSESVQEEGDETKPTDDGSEPTGEPTRLPGAVSSQPLYP